MLEFIQYSNSLNNYIYVEYMLIFTVVNCFAVLFLQYWSGLKEVKMLNVSDFEVSDCQSSLSSSEAEGYTDGLLLSMLGCSEV